MATLKREDYISIEKVKKMEMYFGKQGLVRGAQVGT